VELVGENVKAPRPAIPKSSRCYATSSDSENRDGHHTSGSTAQKPASNGAAKSTVFWGARIRGTPASNSARARGSQSQKSEHVKSYMLAKSRTLPEPSDGSIHGHPGCGAIIVFFSLSLSLSAFSPFSWFAPPARDHGRAMGFKGRGLDFYISDGGRNIPADSGAESLRLRTVLLRSRGGDGPDRWGPHVSVSRVRHHEAECRRDNG
jgi:hypothetical protein